MSRIALYGATGYTGRLVASELQRKGAEIVLSGRNPGKLERLAAELGGEVAIRPASVDDPASLRALLDDCAAVANCAGPFGEIGEQVVAAAIATGTHYVDTTGEQLYIKRIFSAYGARARAAGVAVVPAVGFDFVPGDLIANLAARGMGELDELVIAYHVVGLIPTHGTMLSVLEVMRGGRVVYENGHGRVGPARLGLHSFDFPEPIGTAAVFDYPSSEVLTVPRHVETRKVTSLLSANLLGPKPVQAALPVMTTVGPILARTPAIGLMRAAVRRLPEGPTVEQRQSVPFTVVAQAFEGARIQQATVSGNDVYGITGTIVAEAAIRMADPRYDRSGVLAPAEAWDPASFLDALADRGVTYEVASEPVPA